MITMDYPVLYRDRLGRPIGQTEWSALSFDPTYVQIRLTMIETVTVSTVWTGQCALMDLRGSPLIFETMVLDGHSTPLVNFPQDRYLNESLAIAGHARMVADVRARMAEFEHDYAEASGTTVERLRSLGWVVAPCDCGDEGCPGWQSMERE